jgi:[ribosomal protein S5]-alanine N-acetyltransferase
MMQTLRTPRLVLRSFELADVNDLFAYAKSPVVGPMAGWPPHQNINFSQKIVEHFIQEQEVWAIVDPIINRVIGSIGLHQDQRRDNPNVKMLGYVLAEDYWGQGLMREAVNAVLDYAFEVMKLDLVSVSHFPNNQQSQRVIAKCGFIYEGRLRAAKVLYDGTITDLVLYSLTKEEYLFLNIKET